MPKYILSQQKNSLELKTAVMAALLGCILLGGAPWLTAQNAVQAQAPPLLTTLINELNRAFTELTRTKSDTNTSWAQTPNSARGQRESGKSTEQKPADNTPVPPYFISYSISPPKAPRIVTSEESLIE